MLDFSGSMRFASLLGTDYATSTRASNNPDRPSTRCGGITRTSRLRLSRPRPLHCPIARPTSPPPPATAGRRSSRISTSTPAARRPLAASASYATTPGGDPFMKVNKNTGSSYATCPADLLNISNPTTQHPRRDVSRARAMRPTAWCPAGTSGYSQGPGYWGKTFFLWPPDPTNDWRTNVLHLSGHGVRRWTTTPGCGTATAIGRPPARQHLQHQLHRHSELDSEHRSQSVSLDAAIWPDRLLHDDSQHDQHRQLAAEPT